MRGSQWAASVVAAGALLAGCVAPAPPPSPPPSGPDLVATDITWPALVVGQRVPFSITVQNIGDTATPPNTILDVLITLDVDTANAVDIGWSDNITVPLAPGERRTQVVNGGPDGSDGLWTVTQGAHNVRAYVNSGSLPVRPPITEITRENNFLLETFSVAGPPRTDQIVFVGAGGGIWTMHSDATGVRQLTSDGVQPEVSREGQKIAYVRSFPSSTIPNTTYSHIWVMNADGSDQHEVYVAPPITNCGGLCDPFVQAADTIRDASPTWSPDGTEIAFTRQPINLVAGGVFVMNADGNGVTRPIVTLGEPRFHGAAWSPDGVTIAVSYDYVCCSVHIRLFAADGGGLISDLLGIRNGADIVTRDVNPSWSADSTRIAFDGRPNLSGMFDSGPIGEDGMWRADVSEPPNALLLAPASAPNGAAVQPSFSPDGTRIAFVRGGTIWTMKAIPGFEGTDQDDTHIAGSDPSWGP